MALPYLSASCHPEKSPSACAREMICKAYRVRGRTRYYRNIYRGNMGHHLLYSKLQVSFFSSSPVYSQGSFSWLHIPKPTLPQAFNTPFILLCFFPASHHEERRKFQDVRLQLGRAHRQRSGAHRLPVLRGPRRPPPLVHGSRIPTRRLDGRKSVESSSGLKKPLL